MKFRYHYGIISLIAAIPAGCQPTSNEPREETPRPVSVYSLAETIPDIGDRRTGTVASWKSEEIGFEVAGRVRFVVEPETDVAGKMYESGEASESDATLLASLDPTRFEFSKQSAEADVEAATRNSAAIQVDIDRVIPAQLRAAEAERVLAKAEFDRVTELLKREAATQSDFDKWKGKLDATTAGKEQLNATLEVRRADLAANAAKIRQLEQSLADVQRDLEDCDLYSAYPAQVAQVHAIPGAYVERGDPVLTVQMMDPIKVDFEVSADTARRMRHGNRVAVYVPQRDGADREMIGFVYMIDPTADAETRTFTMTLLVKNSKQSDAVPPELDSRTVARTASTWKLMKGLGGREDLLFTEASAIRKDEAGTYVLKIVNRKSTTFGKTDPVLKVKPVRVNVGDVRMAMLGLFTFREVSVVEGEDFDPATDLIAGELVPPEGDDAAWDGETILEDRPQWLLRPGDLVGVRLEGPTSEGFYVALNSIKIDQGRKYINVVDKTGAAQVIRQIEVNTLENAGKLMRIQAAGDAVLESGLQVVLGPAHFLLDGEKVVTVEEVELTP